MRSYSSVPGGRKAPDSLAANENGVFSIAVVVEREDFEIVGPGFDLGARMKTPGTHDALDVDHCVEARDLASVAVAPNREWQHVKLH